MGELPERVGGYTRLLAIQRRLLIDYLADRQLATLKQALAVLPAFDGFHPVLGAWIVGEDCVGLGLREDRARITHNLSRFKPHFIEG